MDLDCSACDRGDAPIHLHWRTAGDVSLELAVARIVRMARNYVLAGGLGVRGSHHAGMRSRIRQRMAERWEQMTPEEREKARERWGRCGVETLAAKPTTT